MRWDFKIEVCLMPAEGMTVVMPFSKALGVMMSSGLMSRFNNSSNALHHRFRRSVQVQKISAGSKDQCRFKRSVQVQKISAAQAGKVSDEMGLQG